MIARPEKIKFFDCHLHIIDPAFPLYENQGFIPEPFTVDDYLHRVSPHELVGGAVVSGSFQKTDQSYLVAALKKLGKNFVGVTQLFADTADETILQLHQDGIRAVRFNLKRGGSEDISKISHFASRIFELAKWHVELYVDSKDLNDLYSTLRTLPAVSIDHLGLSAVGLKNLLKLAEQGTKVKATGFGRVDFDPKEALLNLYYANPACLMFGTDLPSTRATRPFEDRDIALILDTLDEAQATQVLFENAWHFYHQRFLSPS